MKNSKNALLFILFLILTSYVPYNSTVEKEQQDKIENLEQKISEVNLKMDSMLCELENIQNINKELADPIVALKRAKRKTLFRECKEEGKIIGTNFFLDENKGYSIVIHDDLYKALLNYTGPDTVMTTSLARYDNKRSFHYRNTKAIDIRLDENGERFLSWLKTPEGEMWREAHGLRVFIEDRHRSSMIKKFSKRDPYEDWIFVNPKASGPHIHLDLYYQNRHSM